MKKTTLIFSIFTLLLIATNACSRKNNSIVIPLQMGKNAPVQFGTLQIDQIIWHDTIRSVEYIRLDLRLRTADREEQSSWFISDYKNVFALVAFQSYGIKVKVNEDSVSLVVEKLDFGNVFWLRSGEAVVVRNLSISIEYAGHSTFEDGTSVSDFDMVLSKWSGQRRFHFFSCCEPIKWRNYRIEVFETFLGLGYAKIKVTRRFTRR